MRSLKKQQGFIGALIGAGASMVGSQMGKSSAKASMAFQREMAQKAHQYEVADLRKAGLNPILSGTGGPGARASGGAMPATDPPVTTALNAAMAVANIANIKAQTKLTTNKANLMQAPGDIGSGLGAITTPLADSFRPAVTKLITQLQTEPAKNTAKSIIKKIYSVINWATGNK